MKVRSSPLSSLHSMNSEQISQRVKMGDQLEVPREIDHTAYFPSAPTRRPRRRSSPRTASESTIAPPAVSEPSRSRRTPRATSSWRRSTHFVEHMYDLIARHDGVYDGWGGPVVLKESE